MEELIQDTPITRAINSSSKLRQRFLCPGSAWAEKRINEPDEDRDEAKEGTLLHWKDAHPEESRDELNITQIETLQKNELLRNRFLQPFFEKLGVTPWIDIVEREYFLCDHDGIPVVSHGENVPGHPDRIVHFPAHRTAVIFDSKFGRKEVPAAWINLQLRSYAVMFADNYDVDKIIVAITQPWAKAGNDFHCAEYEISQIPEFRQELLDILAATEPEDAPLNPSKEACMYCKALMHSKCPAAAQIMKPVAVVNVGQLSVEDMEALAPDIELAEEVIDAWKKRMKELVALGQTKLFRLSKGGVNRKCGNAAAAFHELHTTDLIPRSGVPNKLQFILDDENPAAALGALEQFLIENCSASVPDMESNIAKDKKLKKEQATTRLETALGDLITKNPKAGSLEKIPVKLNEATTPTEQA